MTRLIRFAFHALTLLLVGCSSLTPLQSTPTPDSTSQATATPQVIPTITSAPPAVKQVVRIWLPPQFNPNAETPAANLFKQRLEEFENEYPRVEIEVRIKSDVNIIETLSAANGAAPEVLPDLVALSSSDMQIAATAGYLHPLQGLTDILQDPDWYAFARELGRVQSTDFGIPFASDAFVIVYRPSVFTETPSTWDAIISSGNQIAFTVSNQQAPLVLALYTSAGGTLRNDLGAPTLDEDILTQVLSFYQGAVSTGALPIAVRDFKTSTEVLDYFHAGDADVAIVRASSDIKTRSGEYIPMLGLDGTHYSPADGWVWALAGHDTEKQEIAAALASYLVDSNFMSGWTEAAGYLPPRPQALNGWEDETLRISINDVLQSAVLLPSKDVTQILGPILQAALVDVVNGEQAEEAARGAVESLE